MEVARFKSNKNFLKNNIMELKIGNWYKNPKNTVIAYCDDFIEKDIYGYGFINGYWFETSMAERFTSEEWIKVEEYEVFELLKKEAIKRLVWNNPKTTKLDRDDRSIPCCLEMYTDCDDRLWDNYGIVYEKGKWVEPLQEINSIEDIRDKYQNASQDGYKEKENKLSYELDFDFITDMAKRVSKNKTKYPPYNWKKPINIEDLKQSLFRHVLEVMKGNYQDDGETLGHLSAIALNAMFINYQIKNNQ